jgi:hypothetical protein
MTGDISPYPIFQRLRRTPNNAALGPEPDGPLPSPPVTVGRDRRPIGSGTKRGRGGQELKGHGREVKERDAGSNAVAHQFHGHHPLNKLFALFNLAILGFTALSTGSRDRGFGTF